MIPITGAMLPFHASMRPGGGKDGDEFI